MASVILLLEGGEEVGVVRSYCNDFIGFVINSLNEGVTVIFGQVFMDYLEE